MNEESGKLKPHSVYVIDDDRDVRRSLSFMLGAADIRSHPFGSGVDFLEALPDLEPGRILLDLRMPQMDEFQVMDALAERRIDWPVIVMTGHGEVSVAVRSMKLGAVDFIEKPFPEQALLSCFTQAFALLQDREAAGRRRREAHERAASLDRARERGAPEPTCRASPTRKSPSSWASSLRTVEMHRGNMMDRLQASSLAEALTLALEAGIAAGPRRRTPEPWMVPLRRRTALPRSRRSSPGWKARERMYRTAMELSGRMAWAADADKHDFAATFLSAAGYFLARSSSDFVASLSPNATRNASN